MEIDSVESRPIHAWSDEKAEDSAMKIHGLSTRVNLGEGRVQSYSFPPTTSLEVL
jgi:hypothetical protein